MYLVSVPKYILEYNNRIVYISMPYVPGCLIHEISSRYCRWAQPRWTWLSFGLVRCCGQKDGCGEILWLNKLKVQQVFEY